MKSHVHLTRISRASHARPAYIPVCISRACAAHPTRILRTSSRTSPREIQIRFSRIPLLLLRCKVSRSTPLDGNGAGDMQVGALPPFPFASWLLTTKAHGRTHADVHSIEGPLPQRTVLATANEKAPVGTEGKLTHRRGAFRMAHVLSKGLQWGAVDVPKP